MPTQYLEAICKVPIPKRQPYHRLRPLTDLWLNLEGEQRADWISFVRVIARRANLEKVKLQDAVRAERRNAPATLVRSILRAIQQNNAIRTVEFFRLRLPTDISKFLDNASSITSFSLHKCDMEPAEREQGTSDLVAALQRNANIESLELWKLDDLYAIPILEGLRLNTAVKIFIFYPDTFYGCNVPCNSKPSGIYDLDSDM